LNGISCYFISVNRNKKSIALDLKKGKDIVKRLIQQCDILIENYVPGTLDRMGLGYKDLEAINPGLVYCSITGYGSTGPYKSRGGYDVIAASLGGLMHITGPRDGEPCKVGVAMTDLATGLYAHGAIIAALLERHTTKRGQKIEANLLSTQVSSLANLGSNYLNSGMEAKRWGTEHESIVPYEAFRTKNDRWITIGAGNNDLFHEFCDIIGRSDLKTNPHYASNELRVKNRVQLLSMLRNIMASKTSHEWLEIFKNCKFPYGPVNDMESTFADPQVLHNNMIRQLGPYKVVGPPVKYSSSVNEPRIPPPALGQHTKEILENVLQLSDEEIQALYEKSIVQ
jgi:succinate--hydroxymethylglutarate CoA-transferase